MHHSLTDICSQSIKASPVHPSADVHLCLQTLGVHAFNLEVRQEQPGEDASRPSTGSKDASRALSTQGAAQCLTLPEQNASMLQFNVGKVCSIFK